jgi:hypothetical protein
MKPSAPRTLLAGIAGGLAMNITMLLTFRFIGCGASGNGISLNPAIQSRKLIDVWTKIEPLPPVVARPLPIIIGIIIFGIIHAFIYKSISKAWPAGVMKRGIRMAGDGIPFHIFVLGVLYALQSVRGATAPYRP